jgi:hypothetical protein
MFGSGGGGGGYDHLDHRRWWSNRAISLLARWRRLLRRVLLELQMELLAGFARTVLQYCQQRRRIRAAAAAAGSQPPPQPPPPPPPGANVDKSNKI